MPAKHNAAAVSTERTLVITRLFDAPRDLLFAAWTKPEHLARWIGPEGSIVLSCSGEARQGGAFRHGVRSPEGIDHWSSGVFREVSPPKKLVFTTAWEDEHGRPKHETLVTLTFAARGAKTEFTLHQTIFESVASRDLHRGGWSGALEKLAAYLAQLLALPNEGDPNHAADHRHSRSATRHPH